MIILVIFDEIVFCIVELFKVSFVDDFYVSYSEFVVFEKEKVKFDVVSNEREVSFNVEFVNGSVRFIVVLIDDEVSLTVEFVTGSVRFTEKFEDGETSFIEESANGAV